MVKLQRECIDQYTSQLSIFLWRELDFLSLFEVSVEGGFEGIHMDKSVQVTQVYSSCLALILLG
jgi:hypothetical protein